MTRSCKNQPATVQLVDLQIQVIYESLHLCINISIYRVQNTGTKILLKFVSNMYNVLVLQLNSYTMWQITTTTATTGNTNWV